MPPRQHSARSSPAGTPATSSRTLRRRPVVEHLRTQAIPTQPNRPCRVAIPEDAGLSRLEHQLGGLQISAQPISRSQSNPAPRSTNSGKHRSAQAADPPIPSREPSRKVPARKPVPANVMSIPVYDNGTDMSFQEAVKLRNIARSNTIASGAPRARGRTSDGENWLPPSSFSFGSSSRSSKTSQTSKSPYQPSSNTCGIGDASLYPAPLSISKSSIHTSNQNSRPVHYAAHPAGIDKYRNRPLPPTPAQIPQRQARDIMMRKNSHDLLSAAYQAGIPAKAPHTPQSSSNSTGKLGRSKAANEQSKVKAQEAALRHEDAVHQFKLRQDSEFRVLNAKRAVDNGRWNIFKNCYEMEVLTADERQEVNTYIQAKRDAERREREEAARPKPDKPIRLPERSTSMRKRMKERLFRFVG